MNAIRWLNPHGWPGAVTLAASSLALSLILFFTVGNATALLLSLLGYMATKTGVAYLTCRQGGWRRPEGLFIVAYSVAWSTYVGYIVVVLYTGNRLPERWQDALYALMFSSALMSFVTFPWFRNPLDKRARELDRRAQQQDRRSMQQDRRGEGQDERAKLLTRRTIGIDTRSDEIGKREGIQDARDHEHDDDEGKWL